VIRACPKHTLPLSSKIYVSKHIYVQLIKIVTEQTAMGKMKESYNIPE
jgi:predicted nucleic acid-binding protein